MNGHMRKRLHKTLKNKPDECLLLLRMYLGSKTENMQPTSIWRNFKQMYCEGKIPHKFILKLGRNI